MSLTNEIIHEIGKTAKLSFSEEEARTYAQEIGDTFDYLNILTEVDTEGVSPSFYGRVDALTPLREDQPVDQAEQVSAMLSQAPETEGNLIKVPAILDSEESKA